MLRDFQMALDERVAIREALHALKAQRSMLQARMARNEQYIRRMQGPWWWPWGGEIRREQRRLRRQEVDGK